MPQAVRSRKDILLTVPLYIGLAALYLKSCFSIISLVTLSDAIDDILLVVGILFLAVHCLIHWKAYGYKLILFAVILVVLLYGYTRSGETAPLTIALVVIAVASIDNIKPLIKLWFVVTLVFFLVMVCAYALIALFDPDDLPVYHRTTAGVAGRARYSLGFVHPNLAGALLMMLGAAYLYLNYERLNYLHYIVVAVSSIIVFALTYSFTPFLLTILVMILFFVQKRWHIFQRKILNICTALLPIALFIAVFLVSGSLFSESISGFLTGRVTLWYGATANQGMTLFGQPLEEARVVLGNMYIHVTTLDSFYAEGLIVYGLFFSVLFCWLYWRRIRYMDSGFSAEISVLIMLVLFGITEVHITTLSISFPALIMLSRGIVRKYPVAVYQGDMGSGGIKEKIKEVEAELKETPPVSAVVLTHNRKDLAVKAVKSVLSQTYEPMEIIVVDDASSDGTAETVKSLADEFGFQFISIPESETKGGNYARNVGILAAQGTYVVASRNVV